MTADATTKVLDPVCGMTIDPAKAAGSSEYRGETIYFCSKGCKAKFDAEPEKYVAKNEAGHGHGSSLSLQRIARTPPDIAVCNWSGPR